MNKSAVKKQITAPWKEATSESLKSLYSTSKTELTTYSDPAAFLTKAEPNFCELVPDSEIQIVQGIYKELQQDSSVKETQKYKDLNYTLERYTQAKTES